MDYYHKYIKYKTKYKMVGGNIKELSGPVAIAYYENKQHNKKIIVMGDHHGDKNGSCMSAPILSIKDYINNLSNKDITFDLFLETPIPKKEELKSGVLSKQEIVNDYITELINWAQNTYKHKENVRIHFTDIRKDINSPGVIEAQAVFRNAENFLRFLYAVNSLKEDVNLLDVYTENTHLYTSVIFSLHNYVLGKHYDKYFLSQYLEKELFKLKTYNEEIYNKLVEVLLEYLKKYLDIIFSDKKISIDNLGDLHNIYGIGMNTGAAMADIYTISRIMKSQEYKNCILYIGNEHLNIIKRYLQAIDFKLVSETRSDQNDTFRCIRNIMDFEKFFNL